MEANTATSTQVEWVCAIVGLSDMCVLFIDVDGIFVCFLLQNGASAIWRGMKMSSFAGSTLYSTMTNRWSTLEPLEIALRSKESM